MVRLSRFFCWGKGVRGIGIGEATTIGVRRLDVFFLTETQQSSGSLVFSCEYTHFVFPNSFFFLSLELYVDIEP